MEASHYIVIELGRDISQVERPAKPIRSNHSTCYVDDLSTIRRPCSFCRRISWSRFRRHLLPILHRRSNHRFCKGRDTNQTKHPTSIHSANRICSPASSRYDTCEMRVLRYEPALHREMCRLRGSPSKTRLQVVNCGSKEKSSKTTK